MGPCLPLLQGREACLGQPFTVSDSAQKHPFPEAPAGLVPSAGAIRMGEELLLLTHDDSLIEALSGVVAPGSLTVVPDEAALAGQLMSGQAGVVFIDAGEGAAQAAVTAQLTQRLHSQLPDVVLVVAGDGAAQSELAPLITDGTIYRFVHKPVSAQRVKLFVDAAWRKRDGTSSGASGLNPTLSMSQTLAIMPMQRPVPWLGITAGAAVVGVAVVWYALGSARVAAPQSAAPAPEHAQVPPAAPPATAPATQDLPATPIAPQEVRVTARRHPAVALAPARLRILPPAVAIPETESLTISVPVAAPTTKRSPVVAASAATLADASVFSVPDGAPTSTPRSVRPRTRCRSPPSSWSACTGWIRSFRKLLVNTTSQASWIWSSWCARMAASQMSRSSKPSRQASSRSRRWPPCGSGVTVPSNATAYRSTNTRACD